MVKSFKRCAAQEKALQKIHDENTAPKKGFRAVTQFTNQLLDDCKVSFNVKSTHSQSNYKDVPCDEALIQIEALCEDPRFYSVDELEVITSNKAVPFFKFSSDRFTELTVAAAARVLKAQMQVLRKPKEVEVL